MKQLPEVNGSWRQFYDLTTSTVRSTLFRASLSLKLYDYMREKSTADNIAGDLGYNKRNLELILNALAGMSIVVKNDGFFVNSPEAEEFLVTDSSTYIGDFLLYVSRWNNLTEADYSELLIKGPPAEPADMIDEKIWAESAKYAAAYQYSGAAQRVAAIISGFTEFGSMKKMLDLGGGPGFYAMAIANIHPSMQAVVFDQPAVAEVAENYVRENSMEEKVSVLSGNYMEDSLGGKYDLILASATLNFFKNRLDEIIGKIYESLEPEGLFVSHADGLTEEQTHPVNFVTEFLSAELTGNDFSFPSGMIGESMKRVGFDMVRSFFVESDTGEMELTIGKKK